MSPSRHRGAAQHCLHHNHAVIAALADAFGGDGERLVTPIGDVPRLAAALARGTTEPDLLLSDGRGLAVDGQGVVEGALPFRTVFDITWSGRRHVVMGPAQIDRHGECNIALIGDWRRPTTQLLGLRGAPGNAVNHTVSYWVPRHSRRVFVHDVDVVCGPGPARRAELGTSGEHIELRRVVSDLGVFDCETPDHRMRLVSLHPWADLERVTAATTFDLAGTSSVSTTRWATGTECDLLESWGEQGVALPAAP